MGKKEAARQRQLAKKKSKRDNKRKELARRTSTDPTVALAHVAKMPVHDAQISEDLTAGMGIALLARRLPDGRIAFASFLLDLFCLGAKDVFLRLCSPAEYQEHVERVQRGMATRKVSGECLAKLVLGAVEFARSCGLPPHADYRHAVKLLEGLDPSQSTEEFEFGKNGKALYVQGPHDSPARIRQIMARLAGSRGSRDVVVDTGNGDVSILTDRPSLMEAREAFEASADLDDSEMKEEDDWYVKELIDMGDSDEPAQ